VAAAVALLVVVAKCRHPLQSTSYPIDRPSRCNSSCTVSLSCEVYRDIVMASLVKILEMLHPDSSSKWTPKDSRIDVVNALIFSQSNVLFAARTSEGKSLVFQAC
jgi:hypothetical protein